MKESTRNGGGAESGRLADRRDPQHRPARQAPLFVTNVDDTRTDDIAAWTSAPVEDQARLGFAIAHALDDSAPAVDGLSRPAG